MSEIRQAARLTDVQILAIFGEVVRGAGPDSEFLRAYAAAIRMAPRRDFLILRAVSLLLIAKYHLQLPGPERVAS